MKPSLRTALAPIPLTLGVLAVEDRRRNLCGVPLDVSETGVFAAWYADQRSCHVGGADDHGTGRVDRRRAGGHRAAEPPLPSTAGPPDGLLCHGPGALCPGLLRRGPALPA